jgi:ABC-type branched-subunit amino acid transport system substrate-binding protein
MKKMALGLLMIVLLVALVLGGCRAKTAAPAKILVGVPAPLTGMYAGFGTGYTYGMQAAVDDINKLGGVNVKEFGKKLPVELKIVNSESDPVKAGTLAEDLIVNTKINFMCTGNQPPPLLPSVSTVCDRYKMPYVTDVGPMESWLGMRQEVEGHWEYTWAGGFAIATPFPAGDFRAGPGYTVADTWQTMLDQYGNQTNKKVAVFASDDSDGVAWYAGFSAMLQHLGYDAVGADKQLGLAPMDTTDFSSIITEWKNNDCQILWGNAPAPFVGALLRQCATLGFKPKMSSISRAALFYEDISAWGGDIPLGIGCEIGWDPSFGASPGIGGTTPQSLADRWTKDTGKPLNRAIGPGYFCVQVLIDAIERAGSLDGQKVNTALAQTDLMTIGGRVKFNENHFSGDPLVFGQWQKTDKPWVWECPVVISKHDFIKATASPIFPIP